MRIYVPKPLKFCLLAGASVFLIPGCSWLNSWDFPASNARSKEEIQVNNYGDSEPAIKSWKTDSRVVSPGSYMPPPVQSFEEPPRTVQAPLPMQQGYMPMNANMGGDRMRMLEAEVAALRNDYNRMVPAFKQLITTNERLQSMLNTMQPAGSVSMQRPTTPPSMRMQASMPPQQFAQSQPFAGGGSAAVNSVRFGEHKGRTRVVMDLTGLTPYQYDIDNNEGFLVINMPQASWNTAMQGSVRKSPFVAGWSYQPDASGGTNLVVQLKRGVRIGKTQALPPEQGRPPRIYLDIVGA